MEKRRMQQIFRETRPLQIWILSTAQPGLEERGYATSFLLYSNLGASAMCHTKESEEGM